VFLRALRGEISFFFFYRSTYTFSLCVLCALCGKSSKTRERGHLARFEKIQAGSPLHVMCVCETAILAESLSRFSEKNEEEEVKPRRTRSRTKKDFNTEAQSKDIKSTKELFSLRVASYPSW